MSFQCIVTSHNNPYLSGVAKFNLLLAKRMQIPCISIDELSNTKLGPILFSFRLRDDNHGDSTKLKKHLSHLIKHNIVFDLFFHTFDGLDIEDTLIEYARTIFCGNSEIYHALQGIDKPIVSAWCPALVSQTRVIHESRLNFFSFGMAHKIQVKYYKMLMEMLKSYKIDYSLWVSTAFHEKANFGDFNSISHQLTEIFGEHIQFLGFLSDDAINYFLDKAQLFIAFFEKGVRSNNTSVLAAMRRGCAVISNLDEYSPQWMLHGMNILNIHDTKASNLEPEMLKRIGQQAKEDEFKGASWEQLETLMNAPKQIPVK